MKELGFGLMRLPLADEDDKASIDIERLCNMVDTFLASGCRHFDTAYNYHGEMSEAAFKEAVVKRYPRDRFTVTDKMPMFQVEEEAELEQIFNEQLERCGVDYFDYYWLHSLNEKSIDKSHRFSAFEFIEKKKQEGKIRHTGFSFHDTAEVLDKTLALHPELDYVQLQINYLDWEDDEIQSRACYETAVSHGKRIMVMEPVKGGSLAVLPPEAEKVFRSYHPESSAASWAIRYAASLEHVDHVLSGMSDEVQLVDNIKTMSDFKPLTDEEREVINQALMSIRDSRAIDCTRCYYCVPGCPVNIAIPDYFNAYNDYRLFGEMMRFSSFNKVKNLMSKYGRPSECIACGACEAICPQHLPIIDLLEQIAEEMEAEIS